MRFEKFSFGAIRIDGATYEHDVVIDRGEVSKRQKNSVTNSVTRRFPSMRRFHGNAADLWSARGQMADCR
jgi:hypothetical protein